MDEVDEDVVSSSELRQHQKKHKEHFPGVIKRNPAEQHPRILRNESVTGSGHRISMAALAIDTVAQDMQDT